MKIEKTAEDYKSNSRKISPDNQQLLKKQEVEMLLQNMNKTLQEKNERLKLLEQSNSDLNQKLIEFEV